MCLYGKRVEGIMFNKFSTNDVPPELRKTYMQEVYGAVANIDVSPISEDTPLEGTSAMLGLPGIVIARTSIGPCKAGRTRQQTADGDDDVILCMALQGGMTWSWRDDRQLTAGQSYLGSNDIPGFRIFPNPTTLIDVVIPRKLAVSMIGDAETPRQFHDSPEMRLLASYAQALIREADQLPEHSAQVVATHLRDLAALAIGAKRDVAEIASQRGVRAARLKEIKTDIGANLLNPALSATWIAGRHRISERYLRELFADEQKRFTDYVLDKRLARAFSLLSRTDGPQANIAAIAYEAGFSDLSWFNRTFRRRYGITPSEARELAATVPEKWTRRADFRAG